MSKSLRNLSLIFFATMLATLAAVAQTGAEKAFTAIKSMPGTWEGKTPDGRSLKVTFKDDFRRIRRHERNPRGP